MIGTTKKIVLAVLVVAMILGMVAGVSLAADTQQGKKGTVTGFVNGCRGFFGGAATALSKLLGLEPQEIAKERQSGKSLADIAKDRGVSEDKVVKTIIDAKKTILDERVKAGVITKEQEELILKKMEARIKERIKNPNVGPGAGCGGFGGCGAGVGKGNMRGYGFRGGCGSYFGNGNGGYNKSNSTTYSPSAVTSNI